MEKLQNAIKNAREKRDTEAKAAPPSPPPSVDTPQADRSRSHGGWATLTPLTLDQRVLTRNRVVTMTAGQAATSFDILRTKVLLQMREKGWTRLAITSPQPSCGKTTVACNLALGMTRQPDLSAMLFDLDLRRPGVAHTLGYTPQHDICDVLDGMVDFDSQAMRVGDNLAISMARTSNPDPTSLLLDKSTTEQFDEIEAAYRPDLMIFDLPPLLTGDDTRAFLKNVDCTLLILRAEDSKSSQIDTCEKEIAKYTNVLGMVLNSCRFPDETQGYGYY
ncbi:MAG: CpsD/CapB family tyrosine-protein kinase [Pseudomonadota bacterium]